MRMRRSIRRWYCCSCSRHTTLKDTVIMVVVFAIVNNGMGIWHSDIP
jgi:hypothetical protein